MPDPAFRHVLFVGGTGMLAQAARWIARRAERLTLASRNPHALAAEIGAATLPLPAHDPCGFTARVPSIPTLSGDATRTRVRTYGARW